jgi:hypothetical protein
VLLQVLELLFGHQGLNTKLRAFLLQLGERLLKMEDFVLEVLGIA